MTDKKSRWSIYLAIKMQRYKTAAYICQFSVAHQVDLHMHCKVKWITQRKKIIIKGNDQTNHKWLLWCSIIIPLLFFPLVNSLAFSTSAAAFLTRTFSFFSSISSVCIEHWQLSWKKKNKRIFLQYK